MPSVVTTGQITYADHKKIVRFSNAAVYINYGQPRHYNADQNIFIQIEATEVRLLEGITGSAALMMRGIVDGNDPFL